MNVGQPNKLDCLSWDFHLDYRCIAWKKTFKAISKIEGEEIMQDLLKAFDSRWLIRNNMGYMTNVTVKWIPIPLDAIIPNWL